MNFPSMKIALTELPPWTFRTACVATGGLGLLAIGRLFMGHSFTVPRAERRALLIAALFNVSIWQICSALGVMKMEAGSAVIIAYTRSEEHTSELQSLMRISYAVFCLKKKTQKNT